MINFYAYLGLFYKMPEFYLFLCSSILLFLGVFYRVSINERLFSNITNIFILGLGFTLMLYCSLNLVSLESFGITCDYFLYYSKIIFIFIFLIFILGTKEGMKKESSVDVEYLFIIGLIGVGLLLFMSCSDFLYLYLIIEVISLSLYIIALLNKYSNYSTESGLKYFILGSLASCFLIFGISLYYGILGTTNFYESLFLNLLVNSAKEYVYGFILSISLISCGLFFKIGLFPYFVWVADVYEGVHLYVMAFFAIVPKFAILIFISKLYIFFFYNYVFFWGWCLFLSILLSIGLGTLGAIYQKSIKRLWAYSAIGHVGYIMSNLISVSLLNLYGFFFYLFIYILISLGFFFLLFNLKSKKKKFVVHLNDLMVFFKQSKIECIVLILIICSLIGIPPLAGFVSKLNVFLCLVNVSEYILIFYLILFSVISTIYYLRLIKKLIFKENLIFILSNSESNFNITYLVLFIFYINLFFFFFFKYLILFYIKNIDTFMLNLY